MPQTPKNPSDAPAHDTNLSHGDLVPFDTLSSVLSLVRMRCDVVCETQLRSPSGIDFPSGAAHFHAIETGTAMALCGDRPPVSVKSGDCVLFPRGEGHAIATTPDAPRTSLEEAVRRGYDRKNHSLSVGDQGDGVRIVCARFHFENLQALNWVKSLPAVIVADSTDGPASLMQSSVQQLIREMRRQQPGGAIMISRLLDLLILQVLRTWVASSPRDAGWLTGAGDSKIGKALTEIHRSPSRAWSVAELAALAGLSRSTFAERFLESIGATPRAYITSLRMDIAADLLRAGRATVNSVAFDVGYGSEASFSRAFKARFRIGPLDYRRDYQT